MRSWYPIPATALDDSRLRAEHNELLIMAKTIAGINKGWRNHPETNRWRGHSVAMMERHDEVAQEMIKRNMNHQSPWPKEFVQPQETTPPGLIEPLDVMWEKLEAKKRSKLLI